MIGFLKSAPAIDRLPRHEIDPEYTRLRRQVFIGIFVGYAGYYLVRNTLALAIPDILKEHPEYSKAALGTALTGLSLAYGLSKFLMGSISDRSNPRYFLPLGLLLSAGIIAACGLEKGDYASLTVLIVLQTINGWVQGMGWPACGKTMVHWFSTNERGTVVSVWNTAHNVGGGLVANLAGLGVLLFGDWGAKFYFNAALAEPRQAPGSDERRPGERIVLRASVQVEIEPEPKQWIVEGWIRGTKPAEKHIVLTAHGQEEKFSANDDNSGCANLLEIGRALEKLIREGKLPRPARSIRFWWVNEISAPYEYYATHPDERAQALVNINQDMVGAKQSAGTRIQHITHTPWSRPSYLNAVAHSIARMVMQAGMV